MLERSISTAAAVLAAFALAGAFMSTSNAQLRTATRTSSTTTLTAQRSCTPPNAAATVTVASPGSADRNTDTAYGGSSCHVDAFDLVVDADSQPNRVLVVDQMSIPTLSNAAPWSLDLEIWERSATLSFRRTATHHVDCTLPTNSSSTGGGISSNYLTPTPVQCDFAEIRHALPTTTARFRITARVYQTTDSGARVYQPVRLTIRTTYSTVTNATIIR